MGHHLICRTTSANGGTNRYPIQIVIFIYMTVNISTTVLVSEDVSYIFSNEKRLSISMEMRLHIPFPFFVGCALFV